VQMFLSMVSRSPSLVLPPSTTRGGADDDEGGAVFGGFSRLCSMERPPTAWTGTLTAATTSRSWSRGQGWRSPRAARARRWSKPTWWTTKSQPLVFDEFGAGDHVVEGHVIAHELDAEIFAAFDGGLERGGVGAAHDDDHVGAGLGHDAGFAVAAIHDFHVGDDGGVGEGFAQRDDGGSALGHEQGACRLRASRRRRGGPWRRFRGLRRWR